MTQRVALVTGAAGGQGWAIAKRLRAEGLFGGSLRSPSRRARRRGRRIGRRPGDRGRARRDLPAAVDDGGTPGGRPIRVAEHAGQQRRRAASGVVGRRDGRGLRKCLAGQLSRRFPRHARHPRSAARGRACGDRQHLQHRSDPPLPAARRLRLVEVGAARADPNRGRRTGARPASASTRCSPGRSPPRCSTRPPRHDWPPPPCSAASASPAKSPMPSRFWSPRRRRSSPAQNSSSTAGSAYRSNEQESFGRYHRRRAGWLALGILLSRAGFDDFTIFDREDDVGGTWRINTYPGLACDVKSHLYSYSFDLNPNWSRLWSGQPEILAYFERCADVRPAAAPETAHRNPFGALG